MIAKLIVRGKERTDAISTAQRALREFHIGGVKSTIPFHEYMLANPDFVTHAYDIKYIDDLMENGHVFVKEPQSEEV